MEQVNVPGWCVFGMDDNGDEIQCANIACLSKNARRIKNEKPKVEKSGSGRGCLENDYGAILNTAIYLISFDFFQML